MAKFKENPKEVINIITLTEEYISTLNTRCKEHKIPKYYVLDIIDSETTITLQEVQRGITPKKCKQLRLVVADLESNERLILYTLDYVPENPAALLTAPYKRTLYRQFLFEAIGVFSNTVEHYLKEKRAKEAVERAALKKHRENPLTPKEAFNNIK